MSEAVEARAECPIKRLHGRFLLRQLEFSQQYAPMYRRRVEQQYSNVLNRIQTVSPSGTRYCRVLDLPPNESAICVGVLYKEMKLLPRFLHEYQKELIRTDAGDEEEGGGDVIMEDVDPNASSEKPDTTASREQAATMEGYSICDPQDVLFLEDDSGRVPLSGLNIDHLCTGIVLGAYGVLNPNGVFTIRSYRLNGLELCYVDRPIPANQEPCYVAIVCGLEVNLPSADDTTSLRNRMQTELLIDFLGGRLGDDTLKEMSKRISRLVIGGNSIAPTDELRLKKKLRLDPTDHVRLNNDKTQAGVVSSAQLMKELDHVLTRLITTVEVELMPGDNDMSDAFFPQQPLHPILLPNAARYSSIHLVTNPTEFIALSGSAKDGKKEDNVSKEDNISGVNFFVSAGQNVNDVARETRTEDRIGVLEIILQSGCMCPTAPNTLFSYPFKEEDPFLFLKAPHCFVACDQPQFETKYCTLEELSRNTESTSESDSQKGPNNKKEEEERGKTGKGVRMVCVPRFQRTGSIVLVNLNSPTLDTFTVKINS